jgi:DNA-binding MarR family transcriptional regulator
VNGTDPLLAFVLGVVVTLAVGYLWLHFRWSASRRRPGGPTEGSLREPPPPVVDPTGSPAATATADLAGAGSRAGPDRAPSEELRLSERVILHLDRYDRSKLQELAPFPLCQQGMVEALGARQSALTKVLHRLVAAGAVVESTEHVAGGSRRRKVYRPTTLGRLLAKDLRNRSGRTTGARPPT